jgi:hypothetical protein
MKADALSASRCWETARGKNLRFSLRAFRSGRSSPSREETSSSLPLTPGALGETVYGSLHSRRSPMTKPLVFLSTLLLAILLVRTEPSVQASAAVSTSTASVTPAQAQQALEMLQDPKKRAPR